MRVKNSRAGETDFYDYEKSVLLKLLLKKMRTKPTYIKALITSKKSLHYPQSDFKIDRKSPDRRS